MSSDTKVKVRWPRCRKHDLPLALRPETQVGSMWACPKCGAIEVKPEDIRP